MLVATTALLYFLMRRKINKLVRIHDLGLDDHLYSQIIRESARQSEVFGSHAHTGAVGAAVAGESLAKGQTAHQLSPQEHFS